MKKSSRWYIVLLIGASVTVGSTLTLKTQADSATQPGTAADPIITKSYVDQQLNQQVTDQVNKAKQEIISQLSNGGITTPSNPGAGGSMASAVVELKPGQTIYADAGSEIIVRTGKTLAVSRDDNGIPDVTSGKDISPNTVVENNHLLMFPREGRGVKPDPKVKTDIFIMVRGGYQVVNADGTKVNP